MIKVINIHISFGSSSAVEQSAVNPPLLANVKYMADKRKYSDRAEYLKKAVDKRRKMIKTMAIVHKGGKCIFCGYNRCAGALEFHHLDPKGKDFGLGKNGLTRSWEKTKNELAKCVLVCSNCHKEIHAGLLQPSQVIEK